MKQIDSKYDVGDVVILELGVDAKYAPKGLARWDGCKFHISKVKCVSTSERNVHYTYELKCCKSVSGIPYTIVEDWITKVR